MTTTSPVKITKQYGILDYDDITNAGFLCNLSQETLDIISKLSEQVGATKYKRRKIGLLMVEVEVEAVLVAEVEAVLAAALRKIKINHLK